MSKNPFLNACAATAYITLVSSLLFWGPQFFGQGKDTVLAPIAMLSLLTFSVAFMAFTFFYQPILLYVEGHTHQAVQLFMRTLAIFAVLTAVAFALALISSQQSV
jgi:hypothetical protein